MEGESETRGGGKGCEQCGRGELERAMKEEEDQRVSCERFCDEGTVDWAELSRVPGEGAEEERGVEREESEEEGREAEVRSEEVGCERESEEGDEDGRMKEG